MAGIQIHLKGVCQVADQVEIERCGYPGCIVVSRLQHGHILLQIHADDQLAPFTQGGRNPAEKSPQPRPARSCRCWSRGKSLPSACSCHRRRQLEGAGEVCAGGIDGEPRKITLPDPGPWPPCARRRCPPARRRRVPAHPAPCGSSGSSPSRIPPERCRLAPLPPATPDAHRIWKARCGSGSTRAGG